MTDRERELVLEAADIPATLARTIRTPLEREELELQASEYLCHAATRYDPSRGPWRPFAWRFLRWRIAEYHERVGRHAGREELGLELELELSDPTPPAEELALERLEARAVLAALNPRARRVAVLIALGFTGEEVARELGVTSSRVSHLRTRAARRHRVLQARGRTSTPPRAAAR